MATDIVISDVTNGSLDTNYDWVGTGVFDVMMNAVNKNIESQYAKGRITGSDYATVYLGAMQAVLAQSVEYVMKEKVSEAQVDNMVADTGFKERQIIEQELTGAKQRLAIDKDIDVKERTTVLQESEFADKLLTTAKQRLAIDSDISLKEDELEINIKKKEQLEAQTLEIISTTARANTQLNDQLLTSEKQRTLLDTDEELKQYQVDYIQPAELARLQKQTDVAERGMIEQEATGIKQRLVLDKDILLKEEQEKLAYTERVIKDKQAADLGLDNVYKQIEIDKADPDFIYTPKYVEV